MVDINDSGDSIPQDSTNTQTDKKNCVEGVNECKNSISNDNIRLDIAIKMKGYESYASFGKAMDCTGNFISMVVHRKYKPTIDMANKIATKLGFKISDLFDLSLDVQIPQLDFLKINQSQKCEVTSHDTKINEMYIGKGENLK